MQTTGLSGRYCDLHGLRGETRDAPVCPHFRPEKPPIRKFPGRKHDHAGLPTGHFFIPGVARLFCPSAPGRALAAAIRLGPMQTQPLASRFRDLQGVRREPPEDPLVHPFLEGALTGARRRAGLRQEAEPAHRRQLLVLLLISYAAGPNAPYAAPAPSDPAPALSRCLISSHAMVAPIWNPFTYSNVCGRLGGNRERCNSATESSFPNRSP